MSWSVVKKNVPGKAPTYRGFICDLITDIATLPTVPAVAAGSECYCSENGKTYILETDGDWEVKSSSGGGAESLTDLEDIEIESPAGGDVLTYDAETEKWVNASGGGGSGETFYVNVEFDGEGTAYFYTTFDALYEAYTAGRPIVAMNGNLEGAITEGYGISSVCFEYGFDNEGVKTFKFSFLGFSDSGEPSITAYNAVISSEDSYIEEQNQTIGYNVSFGFLQIS